jgi:hypothetical protein
MATLILAAAQSPFVSLRTGLAYERGLLSVIPFASNSRRR